MRRDSGREEARRITWRRREEKRSAAAQWEAPRVSETRLQCLVLALEPRQTRRSVSVRAGLCARLNVRGADGFRSGIQRARCWPRTRGDARATPRAEMGMRPAHRCTRGCQETKQARGMAAIARVGKPEARAAVMECTRRMEVRRVALRLGGDGGGVDHRQAGGSGLQLPEGADANAVGPRRGRIRNGGGCVASHWPSATG